MATEILALPPAVPEIPAGPVPVAAQIRGVERHDDEVARARRDLLVAARAPVGLGGLERLDPPYLDLHAVDAFHADQATGETESRRRSFAGAPRAAVATRTIHDALPDADG